MTTKIKNAFMALLLVTVMPMFSFAQLTDEPAFVEVSGELTNPLKLTAGALNSFKQVSVIRKDKDGNAHTYTGAAFSEILEKAGATMGKQLRGKNLTKYLVVEALDGYKVLFALTELDSSFTSRQIILTAQMDGKPLPKADGPFRIIVQDEKLPARCAKQVKSLTVKFAD